MSWDARINAAARTEAERLAFHLLLAHPEATARLEAMLADNERIDASRVARALLRISVAK